uniref:Uncharacterized protein n=1 Tax=Panagrolaimus davidi TaxID=227884 RepID=A0A914QDQ4_9BILA
MSDNRLVKLGSLLESKNRTIRNEAASVIGQIPFTNVHLLPTLRKFLHNNLWDTRVSASDALAKVLQAMSVATTTKEQKFDIECGQKLQNINVKQIIEHYRPLLW